VDFEGEQPKQTQSLFLLIIIWALILAFGGAVLGYLESEAPRYLLYATSGAVVFGIVILGVILTAEITATNATIVSAAFDRTLATTNSQPFTIVVPALPTKAFSREEGVVIMTLSPLPERNCIEASIFGPMVPGGKCPSSMYLFASSRVILSRSS